MKIIINEYNVLLFFLCLNHVNKSIILRISFFNHIFFHGNFQHRIKNGTYISNHFSSNIPNDMIDGQTTQKIITERPFSRSLEQVEWRDAPFQLQSQMVSSRRFENCRTLPLLFEMNTVEKKMVKVALTFLCYVCNNLCSQP